MNVLTVSRLYPDKLNPYQQTFVHIRNKMYRKYGDKSYAFVPSEKEEYYFYEGAPVIRKPLSQLIDEINDLQIDVVAIHSPVYTWFSYMKRKEELNRFVKHLKQKGIKLITWIHGVESLYRFRNHYFSPVYREERLKKFLSIGSDYLKLRYLKKMLNVSDSVVTVSEWMKSKILNNTHTHTPIWVIPNPIDTDLFSYANKSEDQISKGLSIRSLDWKHGIDVAIKAYSNFEESWLTVLGNGYLKFYFERLASWYNSKVIFEHDLVPHQDLPSFIEKFGFFVAPSRVESQGVSMCEAMSMGLPVVASNVAGIPEFVKDGYNGLLFPSGDVLALRRKIKKLIENIDLYFSLSENARSFIVDNLSTGIIYNKEKELFGY